MEPSELIVAIPFIVGVGGLVMTFLFVISAVDRKGAAQRRTLASKLASQLGLSVTANGAAMSGQLDGHEVKIRLEADTELRISGLLRNCSMSSLPGGGEAEPSFFTGDDAFDRVVAISTESPAEILALLDKRTRSEVMKIFRDTHYWYYSAQLRDGVLQVEWTRKEDDVAELKGSIKRLVKLANVLKPAGNVDTQSALLKMAAGDEPTAVRLNCLELLHRDDAVVQEAFERLASSSDAAEVRLRCLQLLGSDSSRARRAWERARTDASPHIRMLALLRDGYAALAQASSTDVEVQAELRHLDEKDQLGLIPALQLPRAESVLIDFLESRFFTVQDLVVRILAERGSPSSIAALRAVERAVPSLDTESAIARIKERFGSSEGQLSIAPTAATGSLSHAQQSGALTVVSGSSTKKP